MAKVLKTHILNLLDGRLAHVDIETVLEQVPNSLKNKRIEGIPYTLWQLIEHIRLAQRDILDYMIDPKYVPGNFPDDYWPKANAKVQWEQTVEEYRKDREQIRSLIKKVDLLQPLPYGEEGHDYLREILILADHTSYHLGQLVVILRLQGVWKS